MEKIYLNTQEMSLLEVGEGITLATVLAILTISILAVAVYKMFTSQTSTIKLPGGYQFTWK